MDNYFDRSKVEKCEEWMGWIAKIPSLRFSSEWEVKIIPPFAGAIARFHIDHGDAHISVYLDGYDNLGCVGEPYWEIYPYNNGTCRVLMNDTEELMKEIAEALNQQL